jgi:intracellular septation protein A
MTRLAKALEFIRKNGPTFAVEALINFVLPYLIFDLAQPHYGDVQALIMSSAPPILWSIIEFARHRRIDAVSILVLLGIVLSLVAVAGGGSARFLQLREKLVTVTIGLVFLGSALIGKPLIYQLARARMVRDSSAELEQFDALRDNKYFRRTMMVLTVVWGLGLLVDAAVSIALVYALPIKTYLAVNPVVSYTTIGALSLWTFIYVQRQRKKGNARRAAEALAAQQSQATA